MNNRYLYKPINELQQEYKAQTKEKKREIIQKIIENRIKLERIENDHKRKIGERLQNRQQQNNNENETNKILENLLEEDYEEIDVRSNGSESIDSKFKKELDKDFKNNKLMERLNCELDFRNMEKPKKELEKPYLSGQNLYGSYNSADQVASINDKHAFGLNARDFTSLGILKK